MWVSTPMTSKMKVGGFIISNDDHAQSALQKLGYDDWTNGHWKHALQYHAIYMLPDGLFQQRILSHYRKKY